MEDVRLARKDRLERRLGDAREPLQRVANLHLLLLELCLVGEILEAAAAARGEVRARGFDLRQLGDTEGVADGINDLANITNALGDYAAAGRLYTESLEMQRQLANRRGEAVALYNDLGYVAQRRGDSAEAREALEQSLKISGRRETSSSRASR